MAYGDCLFMQDREFVLHSELLKKSGSGHKIKIKEREREIKRTRRAYLNNVIHRKIAKKTRMRRLREGLASALVTRRGRFWEKGGDPRMTARPEISDSFSVKNRRITQMSTQMVGQPDILTSKQTLNFLSICT